MTSEINRLVTQAISPKDVRINGPLTNPRTYGVFEIPHSSGGTRKYRFGNFPIRQTELIREFGACKLCYLFESRQLAQSVAAYLNQEPLKSTP